MRKIKSVFTMILSVVLLFCGTYIVVRAEDGRIQVTGKVYQFNGKSKYEFSSADQSESTSSGTETYGSFSVKGDIIDTGTKDSFVSYTIGDGNVEFSYTYSGEMLNAAKDQWHLAKDDGEEVDSVKLTSKIGYGVLILLTSKDGTTWVKDTVSTNLFEENSIQTKPFYTTNSVQLANGCYYRVIVAYKTERQIQAGQAFPPKLERNEYKKYAEVYEFYLGNEEANTVESNALKFNLGSDVVSTGKDNGYDESNAKDLNVDDPHYGWKMGTFFVSGYTSNTEDNNGDPVFLKNVGDKVSLNYNLIQNIDKLNGEETLSVSEDDNGYDTQFEIGKTNFGRGTLIIQYTDYQNVKHDPVVYTNFLEANASPGADTVIDLFEEGDYEVALDYEIKNDKHVVLGKSLLPEYTDYRTHFKFSVRNGNCMVFPFDVKTGTELTNTSVTENGFRLDLAKSRYLKIFIKREMLSDGADGLVEDTRFNRPAKDGDEYTEEGIYTITVSNEYTKQETEKVIYIGTNPVLKAVAQSGLSYEDIQRLVQNGAMINEDGTIIRPMVDESTPEKSGSTTTKAPAEEISADPEPEEQESNKIQVVTLAVGFTVVVMVVCIGIGKKKKSKNKASNKLNDGGES